ncbi:hypothetical protein G4G27_16675 [Sphingomonas sp. So64.6b]|uniref:LuxR C-terminal-related transcriptional regulator n=1 Tax=Sphingomonas sp. So64.6b TaxID=2997354 RepID=UPI0016031D3A|nr:LuxR C-terminal-related transcriptional regulator [Sphingomonas sp. So64.6b]QNA85446.1 hypothetical protein G4G27_16675 [Sphingomonas sp. So64.6b]
MMGKVLSFGQRVALRTAAAPVAPSGWPRTRLSSLLDDERAPHTILLHAPAGFGKTTLLDHIVSHHKVLGRRAVSVTLGEADRSEAAFDEKLSLVVEDARSEPLLLVFDGLEHIQGHPAEKRLLRLVESLPENLRLAIASREYPSRGVARLRLSAKLRLVGAEELRFTVDETRAWLAATDVHLSSEELAELCKLSDGWPAAMGMAALALAAPGTRRALSLTTDIAAWPLLRQYVDDELFGLLSDNLKCFALETAALSRFTPELAALATGREDVESLITGLEHSGLIVREVEDHLAQGWVRFQPLVARCLERRLETDAPERRLAIHREAMAWHSAGGRFSDAIRHAFAAGETLAAANLLEAAGRERRRQGHASGSPEWSRHLSSEGFAAHPRLHVDAACSLAARFDLEAARAHLATARQRFNDLEPVVRDDLLAVDAMIALYADRPEICLEAAERGLRECENGDPYTLGTLRSIAAVGWIARSSLDKGRQFALEALADNDRAGSAFGMAVAHAIIGQTEMIAGNAVRAFEAWRAGEARIVGARGDPAVEKIAFAYMPSLLYEWNRLDDADTYLARCAEGPMEILLPDMIMSLALTEARLARARGRSEQADRALIRAETTAAAKHWPRLLHAVRAERLRSVVLSGHERDARRLHAEFIADGGFRELPGIMSPALETESYLIAELRFETHFAGTPATISRLRAACAKALSTNRNIRAAKLLALEAICRDSLGDRSAAIRTMRRALEIGSPGRLIRTILDEGPRALALVKATVETLDAMYGAISTDYLGAIIGTDPASLPQVPSEVVQVDRLSSREKEILRLVFDGYSNALVARKAALSENTVKWHLQHIYSKLGVSNRTGAVAVARSLGLFG